MEDQWWRYLKGRPFYWVLDGNDPAASYYMLRYVVERPDEARAVQAARLALQESAAVASLKARLKGGNREWDREYLSPLWALRLLAEWGHPGDDETIATALDAALEDATDSHPYASPLLLYTALAFGFTEDERVHALLDKVLGDLEREAPPFPDAVRVTLTAMGFAALPVAERSATHLSRLEARLASLQPDRLPAFATYAYPTYDTPDGLTLAESALRLGLRGAWLEAWVAQIVAAQDEQGYWRATHVHLQSVPPHRPNRWISAKALYVLRSYYGE